MEILINPNGECCLSKTQKKKLRKTIQEAWTGDEDAFREQTDGILETLHYEDAALPRYNMFRFDYCRPLNRMEVILEHVEMETAEERRERLRKKLHSRLKKNHAQKDARWEAYEKMRSRLPAQNRSMLPSPTQVMANEEMYRNMMSMIPNQNPLHQYLSMFFP